jgi:hypothetical protein
MARAGLGLAVCLLATAATARAQPGRRWLRANFHAHAAADRVRDDGTETPAALHQAVRAAGFDFSVHSPHCNGAEDRAPDAAARYAALRAEEAALRVPGLTIAVGEELTVAGGPRYASHTTVMGRPAPGNLEHLTILGNHAPYPFGKLTPAAACERVHRDGGVCVVNHPGPGPMMWEEGYWEAPANRAQIDAIEVYNGQAVAAIGIDFESRYREATAYDGLGMKVAALTGADTHGPRSVLRAKARVMSVAGPVAKLVRAVLPHSPSLRPELEAATLVLADGTRTEDVLAAVKARRTVATYALPKLRVTVDGLGEVRHTRAVHLLLTLSRKLDEVTLYREGTPVRTWHDVDKIEWNETIDAPAAYLFGARDGRGRMLTSAIWYEPPKK